MENAEDHLPEPLASMSLRELGNLRALVQGGIAAMDRMERLRVGATAAIIVDEGTISLILTPVQQEAA